MSRDLRTLVPEYVLGILEEEPRREMEAGVARSADLAAVVRRDQTAAHTALVDALPVPASSQAEHDGRRSRLLLTLASSRRFRPFFSVLRAWLDLGDAALLAVLARIDEDAPWPNAPFPGVRYLDFQAGPGALAHEAGLLRVSPGAIFPRHMHRGIEKAMVLEGTLVLDGRELHPGAVVESDAGSVHGFAAGTERDLVLLVAHNGISITGT